MVSCGKWPSRSRVLPVRQPCRIQPFGGHVVKKMSLHCHAAGSIWMQNGANEGKHRTIVCYCDCKVSPQQSGDAASLPFLHWWSFIAYSHGPASQRVLPCYLNSGNTFSLNSEHLNAPWKNGPKLEATFQVVPLMPVAAGPFSFYTTDSASEVGPGQAIHNM